MPQIAVSSVIMFLLDTIKLNDWNKIMKASEDKLNIRYL